MSALPIDPPAAAPRLRPLTVDLLDAVMAIEVEAYPFPWTRGNFIDSIAAGYVMRVLLAPDGELLAYFAAMPGFEEMHLLNITTAPAQEGRGHARRLLHHLYAESRARGARAVWLEVRVSNERARRLYRAEGFIDAGLRRDYYPAPQGRREDAILMSRAIAPEDAA